MTANAIIKKNLYSIIQNLRNRLSTTIYCTTTIYYHIFSEAVVLVVFSEFVTMN
jgi:hypothetical protein